MQKSVKFAAKEEAVPAGVFSRCVWCCDSSQMAWEVRICVGKPAGVEKKGLVLNPKHSLPIPGGDCSYL